MKPLGKKAYGSIPHLQGSRTGPKDYHIHEGQALICTVKARPHDRVIVTEKLDGSCVAVAKVDGQIVPLIRAGYAASSSPHKQHHLFVDWVSQNAQQFEFLPEGWRLVGEWLAMAHGTIYEYGDPFVAFDLFNADNNRLPYDTFKAAVISADIDFAHVISDGPPISIEDVLDALGDNGFHNALEEVEGAVWRVENNGKFDFMAKYVRSSKIDGKYFTEISGEPAIYQRGFS